MKLDHAIKAINEGMSPKKALNELLGKGNPIVAFDSSALLLRAMKALAQHGYNDGVDFEVLSGNTLRISKAIYKGKEVQGILGRFTESVTEAETPSKMALKMAAKTNKGYTGPNGAMLVGYQWIHHYEEVDTGTDVVSKKVSDWENAEYCKTCNRKIVHVYYVKPKGSKQVEVYGADHLHIALGYGKPISKSEVTRPHRKIKDFTVEQKRADDLKKRYEQIAKSRSVFATNKGAAGKANEKYMATTVRRGVLGHGVKPRSVVWLYHKQRKWLMRGDDLLLHRFLEVLPGWVQIGSPKEVTKKTN